MFADWHAQLVPASVLSQISVNTTSPLAVQKSSSQLCPPIRYKLLSELASSIGSFLLVQGASVLASFTVVALAVSVCQTLPFTASTTTSCQPPTMAMAWFSNNAGQSSPGAVVDPLPDGTDWIATPPVGITPQVIPASQLL